MNIGHVGLYVSNLEEVRTFYERYFGAKANEKYRNPKTGFESYFLSFAGGASLELMTRPEIADTAAGQPEYEPGYAHIAFRLEDRAAVDNLTARLAADGFCTTAPRTTGDGYYEGTVRDPEGNLVELVV